MRIEQKNDFHMSFIEYYRFPYKIWANWKNISWKKYETKEIPIYLLCVCQNLNLIGGFICFSARMINITWKNFMKNMLHYMRVIDIKYTSTSKLHCQILINNICLKSIQSTITQF